MTSVETGELLLEARGLSKKYGRFTALEPTDITVRAGSIHGLLGKNGAGKSTLVQIIAGSVPPTSGTIWYKGRDITDLSLARRRELGIRLLPQHAEVVPYLSVAENLALPNYPRKFGLVQRKLMHDQARALLRAYDLDFDVGAAAGSLPVPDQRRLSIVRTLVADGALAMLDEPTTALSQSERRSLFSWMLDLNAKGHTFLFISHFNNEIQAICDEVSVLRDGRLVASGTDPREMSAAAISKLVTGADVVEFRRTPQLHSRPKVVVDRLVAKGTEEVSFEIGEGEIVGFVGLPESGAQEVARGLAGLRPVSAGSVTVAGRAVRLSSVRSAIDGGIAYLSHDRTGEGLVGALSVRENLRLGNWPQRAGLVNIREMAAAYQHCHRRLSFRVTGPGQPVEQLSGGNQQKIVLGRLLVLRPQLLILDEPTLGVDVATKEEVHRLINDLTEEGFSVILLAYDTDEMVRMVDRVIAFQDGRIWNELRGEEITADNIVANLHHATEQHTERAIQ